MAGYRWARVGAGVALVGLGVGLALVPYERTLPVDTGGEYIVDCAVPVVTVFDGDAYGETFVAIGGDAERLPDGVVAGCGASAAVRSGLGLTSAVGGAALLLAGRRRR